MERREKGNNDDGNQAAKKRRLQSNRMAAKASREKKKRMVIDLEQSVLELTQRNEMLVRENNELKRQLVNASNITNATNSNNLAYALAMNPRSSASIVPQTPTYVGENDSDAGNNPHVNSIRQRAQNYITLQIQAQAALQRQQEQFENQQQWLFREKLRTEQRENRG